MLPAVLPPQKTPLQRLLEACFPEYLKHMNIYHTITTRDTAKVPCLERQAGIGIVKRAMADPAKRDDLLRVFRPNFPQFYMTIIFGNCRPAVQFVMANLTFGTEARFSLEQTRISFNFGGTGLDIALPYNNETLPEFWIKVFTMVELMLERDVEKVNFMVDFGNPEMDRPDALIETLTAFCHRFGLLVHLETRGKYCMQLDRYHWIGQEFHYQIILTPLATRPIIPNPDLFVVR